MLLLFGKRRGVIVNSVQHIAFNCRDIKRQEQVFTRHFGFRRARVFNAGTADEFIMLRLGSTCLELFSARESGASPGEQTVGFKHLAFEVPDLEVAIANLHTDGIETEPIIDCGSVVPGLRVCFFLDPEGNRIELMQGYQDQILESSLPNRLLHRTQ
jgi:glyoxylase I family protein